MRNLVLLLMLCFGLTANASQAQVPGAGVDVVVDALVMYLVGDGDDKDDNEIEDWMKEIDEKAVYKSAAGEKFQDPADYLSNRISRIQRHINDDKCGQRDELDVDGLMYFVKDNNSLKTDLRYIQRILYFYADTFDLRAEALIAKDPKLAAIVEKYKENDKDENKMGADELSYMSMWLSLKESEEKLKEYRKHAKKLEDFKSHYGDLQSIYSRSGKESDKKEFEDHKKKFKEYLRESDWFVVGQNNMMTKLNKDLSKMPWLNKKETRELLLESMAQKFEKMHNEKYDFRYVEVGIHEFRRDTRAITNINNAFDRLISDCASYSDIDRIAATTNQVVGLGRGEIAKGKVMDVPNDKVVQRVDKNTNEYHAEWLQDVHYDTYLPEGHSAAENAKNEHEKLIKSNAYNKVAASLRECK